MLELKAPILLLEAVAASDLPIRTLQEMQAEVETLCGGKLAKPKLTNKPVAVVKWVDGTLLDTVWQPATH